MKTLLPFLVEAASVDLMLLMWVLLLVIFMLVRKIITDSRRPGRQDEAEEPAEDAREPA